MCVFWRCDLVVCFNFNHYLSRLFRWITYGFLRFYFVYLFDFLWLRGKGSMFLFFCRICVFELYCF